ncbi:MULTISPECIES: M64 family metallopeptidase [unclassified Algibacter]|uniref:T9SS type A sorting domain-containing protein n=1 Tax=unclassified Algibacter TaxID=2615009 RepID=UPI00131ADE05|nr:MULTISPECIES: M64 family metallopeptidase [unclassified Algibacter]MCL5130132.1 M64 family metallo-endopeptidase [Algibacter sp. L4_22]
MKQLIYISFLLLNYQFIWAQVFTQETIQNFGDNDKRLNLVILSEGYQVSEFEQFKTDAVSYTNSMFNESPFKEYANYFNVHIIYVPSNESGADHPGESDEPLETPDAPISPITNVDTYFNATYDSFGAHRRLFYELDGDYANQTEVKINSVLADNFPTYDQALILVNSDVYGASGGEFPMSYTGYWGPKTVIHELGHSMFDLKDEYYPGDFFTEEAINMTKESDENLVKWKNWVGTKNVGVYQYTCDTGNCAEWYKPHQKCIMENLNYTFCPVCTEGIIEKIHDLLPSLESYEPNTTTVNNPELPLEFKLSLIKPTHDLERAWTLNGNLFASSVDNVIIQETDLNIGLNTLTAVIHDNPSSLLKIDNHETKHISTVTWTINHSSLGIESIESLSDNFEVLMFPNPVSNMVNLRFESETLENLKVDIISMEGRKLLSTSLSNSEIKPIDISAFSTGIYLTNFYANNVLIASKRLVKN